MHSSVRIVCLELAAAMVAQPIICPRRRGKQTARKSLMHTQKLTLELRIKQTNSIMIKRKMSELRKYTFTMMGGPISPRQI